MLTTRQKILALRAPAPPLSWRRIAKILELSPTRATQLYADAITKVWRAANEGDDQREAAIAALRASNRQAKRRERETI